MLDIFQAHSITYALADFVAAFSLLLSSPGNMPYEHSNHYVLAV
jgi:hypothetical protein